MNFLNKLVKYIIFALMLTITILSLSACSSTEKSHQKDGSSDTDESLDSPEEYNIGISDMGSSIYPWFQGTVDGICKWQEEHGEEYQIKFNLDIQDSLADAKVMSNNLNGMIENNKDGIILFPVDYQTALPLMQEKAAKKIKFILCDTVLSQSSGDECVWETCVSYDMSDLGTAAGNLAVEYLSTLDSTSPLYLYITDPSFGAAATQRYESFVMTVQSATPDAEILVISETGNPTDESTHALVSDFLMNNEYGNRAFDLVCGYNDLQTLGAYEAFVEAGKTGTKFIGINGNKKVLTYINEGNPDWLGEILLDPVELGYNSMDAMYHSLVLGESLPEQYFLASPKTITPANISEFDWQSWSWLE